MKILNYVISPNGKTAECRIECKGRIFDGVNLSLKTPQNCAKDCECRYDCLGEKDGFTVRYWDCDINKMKIQRIWNIVSAIPLLIFMYFCLVVWNIGIFKSIAYVIIGWVVMDIFCHVIEEAIPKIIEHNFYLKLMRLEIRSRANKKRKEAEEQIEAEQRENEKRAQNPYYEKIATANRFITVLHNLSEEYDFGINDEKIDLCVEKFEEILDRLDADNSGYPRVSYLFEAYLPEFYRTLELYSNYIKAETVTEEKEQRLTRTVNEFYRFLEKQKIDVVYDSNTIDVKFDSTAENLVDMIKKEMRGK